MIPYEELVVALDRYVARNGGTPNSARAPQAAPSFAPPPAMAAPSEHELGSHEVYPPAASYDELHDPDLHAGAAHAPQHEEDATHVGASPLGGGNLPPPLSPPPDDHSNEIDIGDVLADEDL